MIERDEFGAITADIRYWWLDGSTQPFEARIHDGSGTLVATRRYYKRGEIEYDASGAVVNVRFYTKDHTGSVRDLVDDSGQVQAKYDYDPYGRRTRTAVSNSTADTVVSYTGHHWHEKSGVYLTMTRQYDPELGRWLSRDPLEEEGGMNLYGYVLNNPIILFDPTGLAPYAGYANGPVYAKDQATFLSRATKGAGKNVFTFNNPSSLFTALKNAKDITRLDLHSHGNWAALFTGTEGERINGTDFITLAEMIGKKEIDVAKEAEIRIFACDQAPNALMFSELLRDVGRGDISVTGGLGRVYANGEGIKETHAVAEELFRTYKNRTKIDEKKTIPYE